MKERNEKVTEENPQALKESIKQACLLTHWKVTEDFGGPMTSLGELCGSPRLFCVLSFPLTPQTQLWLLEAQYSDSGWLLLAWKAD